MIRRATQPDTSADVRVRECINAEQRRSFVMVAGAGSGKTTSLIKGLAAILTAHRDTLKRNRQRVACITYTEIAAGEIWTEVGNNPLIHVSTIHSFLWTIVRSFQSDIRNWVGRRIDEKLDELRTTSAAFGPRVQERTREKNRRDTARYELERARITSVPSFTYGTGSHYSTGVLGHDDIIKMVPQFLAERPLFRTLLAQQFPLVFVDESQDTTKQVVDALKAVDRQMSPKFCLGFFGDPMQQIYMTGIGEVPLEDGWLLISKPENFRCPSTVLAVANAIRRDGDGLTQVRGRTVEVDGAIQPVTGTARIFVLPADAHRQERLDAVRDWIARHNDDPAWRAGPHASVKVFVIVHRMAAARLGFAELYSALNDKAPEAFKNGFLDETAWPLRPFVAFVMPLSDAIRNGHDFEAMTILRDNCPRLAKEALQGQNVAQVLSELQTSSKRLADLMVPAAGATNREILQHLLQSQLITLDPRILGYIDERPPESPQNAEEDDGEETSREISAMDAFLGCPASQFWGYRDYVKEQSPFSTQQGIKGAEFPRVLVVLDDDEGTHSQFSYDKYFGIKPLSARDQENMLEGAETSIDRTRRLFYVCCTRALTDLAVVLFSTDVGVAERRVRAVGIFPENAIHTLADLTSHNA
jgi:DNA helicase-2/ATP-dependent DNA helicase PcrA